MHVISFCNQKGGVGKTTSTLNTGAALAARGVKVLLIDLDAQGNLTASAGVQISDEAPTVYEVLKGSADINAAIVKRGPYDILPADIRLSGAELELSNVIGRERLLQEAIAEIKTPYEYILIDCPPSLSLITLLGLTACKYVIVPIQSHFLALTGCAMLLDTVKLVKKRMNPEIELMGALLTMYDSRRNLDGDVAENVAAAFTGKVLGTISNAVSLAEAPGFGKDILEYAPRSKGAIEYEAVATEIIKRAKEI